MQEKQTEAVSVDEITILRLAGEESSIVGHCPQFYSSTVLEFYCFIKQFLALCSEAIFNLRPKKRTSVFC